MKSQMLYLGKIDEYFFTVKWSGDVLAIDGNNEGFYGYKLDDRSGDNGIFVEWKVESNRLTLTNDRFGMYPVFYSQSGNEISFSSSISNLITKDDHNRLDYEAIALFLRTGSFFGNRTPFLNIKALPAAKLEYDRNGLRIENYEVNFGENHTSSVEEARYIYRDLFTKTISKFKEAFSGKVGLPLSGGKDSRHILFELMEQGLKPEACLTMKHQPPKPNEDANIAKFVCSTLGVNHVVFDQDPSFLELETEKNKLTSFCALEHSWILPLARYLKSEGYSATFDGIAGDVLSAGHFLTKRRLDLYRKEKYEELANDILSPEGYLPRALTNSVHKKLNRESATHLIISELEKFSNAPNPVGQFYLHTRTRRNVGLSAWGILQQNNHVFAPFLDIEIYDFLSSLPAEYFLDHSFHQVTMAETYPQYAHIPFEDKNALPQKGGYCKNACQIFELTQFVLKTSSRSTLCRRSFLLPRLVKSLFSTGYYDQNKGIYRIPVYFNQLLNS